MAELIDRLKEDLKLENVLALALKVPGVTINRELFLRKELKQYCTEETLDLAVRTNPAKAGVPKETINRISKAVIDYESTKVTAISIAASLPSSANALAAVGAASADIVSYFSFVLRVVQELAYLYGFEEIEINEDSLDSETMNYLMVFMGCMFGVQGASSTLTKLANTMAEHVAKNLARKALTQGTIYPVVKEIAKKVGVRMTKQIFADTVASGIPIAGSLLSGGLTYALFKPNCLKLRKHLMEFNLCDPEYYKTIYV